jgi:hypothetical protein
LLGTAGSVRGWQEVQLPSGDRHPPISPGIVTLKRTVEVQAGAASHQAHTPGAQSGSRGRRVRSTPRLGAGTHRPLSLSISRPFSGPASHARGVEAQIHLHRDRRANPRSRWWLAHRCASRHRERAGEVDEIRPLTHDRIEPRWTHGKRRVVEPALARRRQGSAVLLPCLLISSPGGLRLLAGLVVGRWHAGVR